MKLLFPLLVLFALAQASEKVERLIDHPLTVKSFHERKEKLIGARVAIAAYYFHHLEGSWIAAEKEKPYKEILRVKYGIETSCFTKDGEKVFEFQLNYGGFPCFAYGTVRREKKRYYIELDSVYEVELDDQNWLDAYGRVNQVEHSTR